MRIFMASCRGRALPGPIAAENLGRRAGHVNRIVGFRPLQFEVAAGVEGEELARGAGRSKKDAEQAAAETALDGLGS